MFEGLPIDRQIPDIVQAVRQHANVVLTASPGAGKTTRLPPSLLKSVKGKILVLEPRRMAAVAAANRVAQEQKWVIGEDVGYKVRFESRASSRTRLVFMTDALALRHMIDDPELADVDLVVIDEFHERNLNQDLILGCVRELQELGRDIKMLVMSATLDTDRLMNFLPDSIHIDVPGRVFPLEIRHSEAPLSFKTDFNFINRIIDQIYLSSRETEGDVLVFLPGVGEIARVRAGLEDKGFEYKIETLHGSLNLDEQQRVLRGSDNKRIILSTNVAEASVTVDGVDAVIDCGLVKLLRTDHRTGFSNLELSRISLFNARQRAGRAARQKTGVCWRLWTTHEEVTQAEQLPAEVQRVDLSQAFLLLAHLGVPFSDFAWIESPSAPIMAFAEQFLYRIEALDAQRRLTDKGRRLIQFPLPPRWGNLLMVGESLGYGSLAARMAAILNEKDIIYTSKNSVSTSLECDLLFRLETIAESKSHLNKNIREAALQLESYVDKQADYGRENEDHMVRKILLLSQRDRLARRRAGTERAIMNGGRGLKLTPESQVRNSEFLVALHGMNRGDGSDTTISMACGVDKPFILANLKDYITIEEDIYFDEKKGQFFKRRVRYIEDLAIDEPSLSPADPKTIGPQLANILLEKWDWFVSQNEELSKWMQRLRFAESWDSKFSLSDDQIRQFIESAVYNITSIEKVLDQNLVQLLEGILDRKWLQDFRHQVPESFMAATGFSHRIDYKEVHAAYVDIRLQEMFGVNIHPRILDGRLPLTFRLLGPNFRPVQVTSDLSGFWRGAYMEVRKELRARYPKHSWPEDPTTAKAEAKGRRR